MALNKKLAGTDFRSRPLFSPVGGEKSPCRPVVMGLFDSLISPERD
jgi:hypothetical protein